MTSVGMAMTDLAAEFSNAVCSITRERFEMLVAAGIQVAVAGVVFAGLSPVETYGSGLYEPCDEGSPAVLVPCGYHDGLNWHLDDLAAFHLDKPNRWWRRLGTAAVLGDIHGFSAEPKRLHARPLDWLMDGGKGLCVLDWAVDPIDLLAGAGKLVAGSSLINRLRKTAIKAVSARLDTVVSHG